MSNQLKALSEPERLFREGKLHEAAETALSLFGGPRNLPSTFFGGHFSSRQDLCCGLSARDFFRDSRVEHLPNIVISCKRLANYARCSATHEAAGVCSYVHFLCGQVQEGAKWADRALRLSKGTCGWTWFLHGMGLWFQSCRDGARRTVPSVLSALDRAIELEPENAHAYLIRAHLRGDMGDGEGRLADAEKVMELLPRFAPAIIEMADALADERRDFHGSLKILDGAVRDYPNSGWAWAHRARMRTFCGDTDGALADFARALRNDPSFGPIYAWRGELWRRLGNYKRAILDFNRAICLEAHSTYAYQWRGRVKLLLGRSKEALSDLSKAAKLEPRGEMARAWRAEAYWKMGLYRKAFLEFESLMPTDPMFAWNCVVKPRQAQELLFPRGNDSGASRRARFLLDLDHAAKAAPKDSWVWAFRGWVRALHGEWKQAVYDLSRAIQIQPDLFYAYRWRGEALRRAGAFHRALDDLNQAVFLNPHDFWSLAFRALTRDAAGDALGAKEDFEKALSLQPQVPRLAIVYCWFSKSLFRAGFFEKSLEMASQAWSLNGRDAEITNWMKQIKFSGVRQ